MEIVLTKMYLSNVFQVFHGFFNNTFAVKTKPDATLVNYVFSFTEKVFSV